MNFTAETNTSNATTASLTGKRYTSVLRRGCYGVLVQEVRDITAVPQTSDYVKGVIGLLDKTIPVADAHMKFRPAAAAKRGAARPAARRNEVIPMTESATTRANGFRDLRSPS